MARFIILWSCDKKTSLCDFSTSTLTKMSSSLNYLWATDTLSISIRSLPYRELQKKCSSAKLCATGPQHVLINRHLDYLRSSNSAMVTGNDSEVPTLSDNARAAASTSRWNTSTRSIQNIVDISSDSDDSTTTTDSDEATAKTSPVQGHKQDRQDSEVAVTRPLLKRQKTDNQPYEAYICPITQVSTAAHYEFLFLLIFSFPFHPCHNRTSLLTQWLLKILESTTNMQCQSILTRNEVTKCCPHTQNNSWAKL